MKNIHLILLLDLATARIGYVIHGSFLWSVMDFIFSPVAWFKWLVLHQVCLSVIKEAFGFLSK
jgi:hypothetical protein